MDAEDETFMKLALDEAQAALLEGEVPVGCVVVDRRTSKVLCKAHNATNVTRNATRHAEFLAIDVLLECHGPSIFQHCHLYVTVEPCIMCASALSTIGIGAVTYGCGNDKFGGCGSILSLHTREHFPADRTYGVFDCRRGVMADEAVEMLRKFYSRGNPIAPKSKRPVEADALRLEPVTAANVDFTKQLHEAILPALPPPSHYEEVVKGPQGLSWLATWNDAYVGEIGCRLVSGGAGAGAGTGAGTGAGAGCGASNKLYICTLSVKSRYRRKGIGKRLLNAVWDARLSTPGLATTEAACLHVHVGASEAQAFYRASGFTDGAVVPKYYRSRVLSPPDALVMVKELAPPPAKPTTAATHSTPC